MALESINTKTATTLKETISKIKKEEKENITFTKDEFWNRNSIQDPLKFPEFN